MVGLHVLPNLFERLIAVDVPVDDEALERFPVLVSEGPRFLGRQPELPR